MIKYYDSVKSFRLYFCQFLGNFVWVLKYKKLHLGCNDHKNNRRSQVGICPAVAVTGLFLPYSHIPVNSGILSPYPHLFTICHRSIESSWPHQRISDDYQPNSPLPSLGNTRVRSCSAQEDEGEKGRRANGGTERRRD